MNQLQIFKNQNFEVRAITQDGEPLFCLADICKVLEIQNPTDVKKAVEVEFGDDLDLIYPITDSLGREQKAIFITEPQLYFVMMRSDKPKAKPFRMWVNGEVIPSIRKHGVYAKDDVIDKAIADPDSFIKILTELKSERAKSKKLEQEAKENQSYVIYAKAVEASATSALIGDFVKTLCDGENISVGRNRIFKWLKQQGYLMNDRMPYQKYLDNGYFEVIPQVIITPKGAKERFTTRITAKGQVALSTKIIEHFKAKKAS
ncbi:phage antirepressor [Campylobacter sp. 19-13652]|uniref:phage antirepressor n=1 Tax=Campylobacter sp. 19-13652 TaxID=2840180 RepID=UPI001C763540|nr:phage antirepressor [Campylobacter sp. 19-13652]BCX79228.1 putative antirepressor - phage associated [Campylobacter sp. 19-13652]